MRYGPTFSDEFYRKQLNLEVKFIDYGISVPRFSPTKSTNQLYEYLHTYRKTRATRTRHCASLLRTQGSKFVTSHRKETLPAEQIYCCFSKLPELPMLACKRALGTNGLNGTLPVLLPEELPPLPKREKVEPTKVRKLRQQRKKYVA